MVLLPALLDIGKCVALADLSAKIPDCPTQWPAGNLHPPLLHLKSIFRQLNISSETPIPLQGTPMQDEAERNSGLV
jgi:hypothetical protein